ncbi:hypothetical protein SAMN05660666_01878 [Novosphingobium aromaticivorans]|uniref:hypothetical protein n=1 Tax=Novosphingobium aromaticivorans TaxID=48935 RepID=UPI000038A30F|nr:hypothetical protein [Novosphingobium aromaticivorans]SCY49207.1 hypothetical protein SAMN05660666_01878 [Novosphingobium aromaticivorans]
MLLATLIAAALPISAAAPALGTAWAVTCAAAPGRPANCLPHKDAREAAPRHSAASRIVCHPDPTKSIHCFNQKARKAAEQRAEAARKADEA